MSNKVWKVLTNILLIGFVCALFSNNKNVELIALLLFLWLGFLAWFRPLEVIKMSEGRWSLGLKLNLEGKTLSKKEIILCRIFSALMCSFALSELYRLLHQGDSGDSLLVRGHS